MSARKLSHSIRVRAQLRAHLFALRFSHPRVVSQLRGLRRHGADFGPHFRRVHFTRSGDSGTHGFGLRFTGGAHAFRLRLTRGCACFGCRCARLRHGFAHGL